MGGMNEPSDEFGGSTSVTVPSAPTADDIEGWTVRGRDLARRHAQHQFAIADWLLEGESLFGFDTGALYDEAEKVFPDFRRGTFRVWMSVARAFPSVLRITQLTFGHHAVVMAAPEDLRPELLRRACADGLSVSELRDAVDDAILEQTTGADDGSSHAPANGKSASTVGSSKPSKATKHDVDPVKARRRKLLHQIRWFAEQTDQNPDAVMITS